jgi:UDP-N-acetylglucosamine 2-epimerase (non-hydrolysing)
MRVLSVIGTRPEAVKMAPVIQKLAGTPGVEARVCMTAQHREMADQVLRIFKIVPDIDLDLMQPNQSLPDLTARIFTEMHPILLQEKPDWILAQGDTTTVMVTAILAYYHRIRFGHVEAGLRTHDKWKPFPEEINRRVAGVTADLHFAPTPWARDNLLRENVPTDSIVITGNPVIDALRQVAIMPESPQAIELVDRLGLADKARPRFILVTAHRRENFGQPLQDICLALRELAEKYGEHIRILYPVHLNPNVQNTVYPILGEVKQVSLVPPLDYLTMVHVMKLADLVLTDSGGLQEEAPGLGVPVLVMRETTERPEGIDAGTVRLVGTNRQKIVSESCRLLDDPAAHAQMAQAVNPYGDGHAAERIVNAILSHGQL